MKKLKLCGVAVLLLVCSLTTKGYCQASQEAISMTLEECLEYAKQNSITLQKAKLEIDNSDASIVSAKGNFLPSISGSVSQSLSSNPLSNDSNKSSYGGSYGLDLSMTLYNGGKNRYQLQQSLLGSEVSNLELAEFENSLEVAVTEVYVEILYAIEQIEVAKTNVEMNLKNEERGKAFFEAGSINEVDYAQLQSATATSRYSLVVSKTQLSNLYVVLKQLLEISNSSTIAVVEPAQYSELTDTTIPSVSEVYDEALESRPEIQSSKLNVQTAELSTKIAQSGYLPTLSLSAGTGVSHNSSSSYTFSGQLRENFSTSVGLNLSVPIFSRFSNRTAVRIAKNNAVSAELSLTEAEKDLYQTIETLHNNATTSYAKYVMSEYLLAATQKSMDLTTQQYELGMKNIIELLTEQDNYNQTYQDFLTNKYQLILNKALLNYYKTNIIKL
ncbi:MAG: TolC family protein [Rikenellaceae bacterium]